MLPDDDVTPTPLGNADRLLRALLAVNLVLLVLSFIPAFSGTGARPGLADALFGKIRFGGWRADVVWMVASSLIILIGALRWTRDLAWLPCLLVYLGWALLHMFG